MSLSGYKQFMPGRRFLVKFGDDPGYVHERVALWPLVAPIVDSTATSFAILTAHGHAYEEAAADYVGFCVLDDGAKEYPEDFVGDDEVIQFSAPIPDADLLSEIQSARRSAKATAGKRPQAKPSTRYVDWGGGEHDLPGLGVGDRLAGSARMRWCDFGRR